MPHTPRRPLARLLAPFAIALTAVACLLEIPQISHTRAHSQAQDERSTQPSSHSAAPLNSAHRITHGNGDIPVAWTPDGQGILVQRPGQVREQRQAQELWRISLNGSGQEIRLADDALYPAFSQAGLAYLAYKGSQEWHIVLLDLRGAETSLGDADPSLPPRWAQDQVFYLAPDRSRMVSVHPSTVGSSTSRVKLPVGSRPRLGPDGQRLAATDGRQLWIIHNGQKQVVVTAEQIYDFAWSPLGTKLAYVCSLGGPAPELWIWDPIDEQRKRLLQAQLEHWGPLAWAPDDRRVAFARHPTGSGPNANGDVWVLDTQTGDASPLLTGPADQASPLWSTDGARMAYASDGSVWVIDVPPTSTRQEPLAQGQWYSPKQPYTGSQPTLNTVQTSPLGLTAPLTIRVKHDAERNTCRDFPHGYIQEYELEAYVERVVPHEVYASWPAATLQAQAIAARTYAWRKALDRRAQGENYDVWDSTLDQYMCDQTYPLTSQAVEETRGQYLSYGNKVIYAFYSAEAGSPTNYRQEHNLDLAPYLSPVQDPVSLGETRWGHSWGMGQWGAYRWAAWHGWTDQQILCHYYSGASVAQSADLFALDADLLTPWPDAYLASAFWRLRANVTAGATDVLTVSFSANLTGTWTPIEQDTAPDDGWMRTWMPPSTLGDTLTRSVGLRVKVSDAAGRVQISEPSWVGVDRVPPTGTVTPAASEVTTLSLSLVVSAADPGASSAPVWASLGDASWEWQDTDLYTTTGELVPDGSASDGSAWWIPSGTSGVLFGPYTGALSPDQGYRAWFRVRVPTASLSIAQEIARLDIVRDGGTELLGIHNLRGTDLSTKDYQDFPVDFWGSGGDLAFRVHALGISDLWVDRIAVGRAPVQATETLTWALPAREGPSGIHVWLVDRAELAARRSAVVTVTDRTAPQGWRNWAFDGGTCSVQVRDAIAGLAPDSASYRFSTDQGLSWSDWLPADCTGSRGSHHWETLSASIPVPASWPLLSWVQFSVADAAALPNPGTSPTYVITQWGLYLPSIRR